MTTIAKNQKVTSILEDQFSQNQQMDAIQDQLSLSLENYDNTQELDGYQFRILTALVKQEIKRIDSEIRKFNYAGSTTQQKNEAYQRAVTGKSFQSLVEEAKTLHQDTCQVVDLFSQEAMDNGQSLMAATYRLLVPDGQIHSHADLLQQIIKGIKEFILKPDVYQQFKGIHNIPFEDLSSCLNKMQDFFEECEKEGPESDLDSYGLISRPYQYKADDLQLLKRLYTKKLEILEAVRAIEERY